MIMIIISTTIFQNITEKLKQRIYFSFTILGAVITAQLVMCHLRVKTGVKKIAADHK